MLRRPKVGFINRIGQFIIEPQFDDATGFSDGLATVYVDGKSGCINKSGQFVINLQEKDIGRFSEGLRILSECIRHAQSYTTA